MSLVRRSRLVGGLLCLMAAMGVTRAASACLNTGTLEPCHCIENMMMAIATPGASVATPTLTGSASPAASQSFYVGDSSPSYYFSAGPANTGGPIDVTIQVGDTITWMMDAGSLQHILITTAGSPEAFNVYLGGVGATASHTFMTPGTYYYYCELHDGVTGTVNGVPQFYGLQHASVTVVASPEPASLALFGVAGIAVLMRRRSGL